MVIDIITVVLSGWVGYMGYNKAVKDKLDSPANNEAIKGLEKKEIKAEIDSSKVKVKDLEQAIKTLEDERKNILKSSDTDKAEKAQEKLTEKEEKIN